MKYVSEIIPQRYVPAAVVEFQARRPEILLRYVFQASLVVYAYEIMLEEFEARAYFQSEIRFLHGEEVLAAGIEIACFGICRVEYQLAVLVAERYVGMLLFLPSHSYGIVHSKVELAYHIGQDVEFQ